MGYKVIEMPDYKKMYLTLFRATEEAVNILLAAQRECEEQVISEGDNPPGGNLTVLPRHEDKE